MIERNVVRTFGACILLTLAGCATVSEWLPQPDTRVPGEYAGGNRFDGVGTEQEVIGDILIVIAGESDTLPQIARRFDVGYDEIVGANPEVDVWLPGAGTRVIVPLRFVLPDAPREGIVINVAARRLFYFPASSPGTVVTYPVGIGRDDWATPLGEAAVTDKLVDPTWYPPPSIRREHRAAGDPLPGIVPPGPENPLGRYALLLSMDGYLIHGTNKPGGVGMQVSHGCIRLYPEDIETLFADIALGTPVRIVDQPVLAGWRGVDLYVQSYADSVTAGQLETLVDAALVRGSPGRRLRHRASETLAAVNALRAVAVPLTRRLRTVEAVLRDAPVVDDNRQAARHD